MSTNHHSVGARCTCALCASAIALAAVADRIEVCSQPSFCAIAPPPYDVGPHNEQPQPGALGPAWERLLSISSTRPTGTIYQASAHLVGQSTLTADATLVHGSTSV